MYYANPNQSDISIRVAETDDPELRSWRKGADGKEVMVSEPGARDPQIIQERSTGRYLMYYVASMKSGAEWKNIVRVRMSSDLLSWSEPHTVLGTPPGYVAAESVFVLEKNGYYYMWISGFDYARMSLYVSTDPLNFGDAEASRIEEQSGHAPEIVQADGQYWMACVAIASVPGLSNGKDLPIAQHDLEGVYLQQLEWKEADESALKKITRRVG
jgi:hypothetical protein